jgi:hypothetical protein
MKTLSTACTTAVLLSLSACSQQPASPASSPAQTPATNSAKPARAGTACDLKLITEADVAPLLSEKISSVEPLKGDAQSCVFNTAGFSTVTVALRPGLGNTTVDTWLSGRMPTQATSISGVGDKAAWTDILKEVNATKDNVLCDIGAVGPATGPATQERVAALCTKIFAAY